MVTLVGEQRNLLDAVRELVRLEYDAILAYEESIVKLDNPTYKEQMQVYLNDHEAHIAQLQSLEMKYKGEQYKIYQLDLALPKEADLKAILTKGKVQLAALMDDNAILAAMYTNELDTNQAYANLIQHKQLIDSTYQHEVLKQLVADENLHNAYTDKYVVIVGQIIKELRDILSKARSDEKKHKEYLEGVLNIS